MKISGILLKNLQNVKTIRLLLRKWGGNEYFFFNTVVSYFPKV